MVMTEDKDPEEVKTAMRRKEPQAGDASARRMELKKRRTELLEQQAEAAGVYKKGYAKPLRVDSPAGIDLEADRDPEEGAPDPGSLKDFDQDIAPDEDTLHMDLVRLYAQRGRDSKKIYEAAKARREAKKTRTASGRPGPGPGPVDPPKGPSLTETNTGIYKKYLPEHLHDNPDALDAAAKNAAKKNWEDKFSHLDPVKDEKFTLDGKEYDKLTYPGGEVFIIGRGEVYRDHDTAAHDILYDYDGLGGDGLGGFGSALFTPESLKYSAEEAEGLGTFPKREPILFAFDHFGKMTTKAIEGGS
jgi:hypothetical protein